MSKLDKDQVIADYQQAYQAAHGSKPEIEAKGGWYSVNGGKNIRLAQLAEEAAALAAGGSTDVAAEPVAKKAPANKAPAKKAAAPNNSKQKEYTVVKNAEDGYDAEEFWIVYLAEKDHDTRLPRGVV